MRPWARCGSPRRRAKCAPICWPPRRRCWPRIGGAAWAWKSPTSTLTLTSRYLADPVPDSNAGPRAGRILAALPDHYRRVLELRFLEGCSIKEAASALAISVNNAKVLQHRALRMAARLAEELDQ